MMRLSKPLYSIEQTLTECIKGITGNKSLQQKLDSCNQCFTNLDANYSTAASAGELHTISPISTTAFSDPDVVDSLKKSELIKIYEQYFVPSGKPARKIYDALLNSAKDKCPFCGGIGTPRNLDHFLPKAHFPQFSFLPRNLVPVCRDCNMDGKGEDFATNATDQIIQPYSDKECFFVDQWISARYHVGSDSDEPGVFEYYTAPPDGWEEVDKSRAWKHFKEFGLAKCYAVKAAEQLGTVLIQIKKMKQAGNDMEDVKSLLLQSGVESAPFVNHWQKGMYQALIDSLNE